MKFLAPARARSSRSARRELVLAAAALCIIAGATFAPAALAANNISFPYWPSAQTPLLPCTGLGCVDLCQLLVLAQHVIYFAMTLAVEIVAPVIFIWGGFVILTSGGSEERVSKGRSMLWGTVVGIFITLGAFLIVATFLWLIGAKTSGTGVSGGGAAVSWPSVKCVPPPLPGAGK